MTLHFSTVTPLIQLFKVSGVVVYPSLQSVDLMSVQGLQQALEKLLLPLHMVEAAGGGGRGRGKGTRNVKDKRVELLCVYDDDHPLHTSKSCTLKLPHPNFLLNFFPSFCQRSPSHRRCPPPPHHHHQLQCRNCIMSVHIYRMPLRHVKR